MNAPFDAATWGTVGQWAAAGGTLCAVVVALFKDEYLRARRRPRLRVTAELKLPHCHKTFLGPYEVQRTTLTTTSAPCYYLRLWIANRGKSRAENVQVFVASVLQRAADGTFVALSSFLPMNLRWSHGRPDGSTEVFAEGIAPGMGKHCDLLEIVHPDNRAELNRDLPESPKDLVIGAVQVEVFPNTRTHLLTPGVYRLNLLAAAANARPMDTTVELTISGQWLDDEARMFVEGLGLKTVA